MTILVTLVHIVVCLILIGVVLLQTGKRADLAGAFGGGGSETAFGARGAATTLSRATTGAAVLFMVTSLALTILYTGGGSRSVLEQVDEPAAAVAPEDPAADLGVTGDDVTSDEPIESTDPVEDEVDPGTDDPGTDNPASN